MNTQEFLEAIWDLQDLHRELIHNIERLLERTQTYQEPESSSAIGYLLH